MPHRQHRLYHNQINGKITSHGLRRAVNNFHRTLSLKHFLSAASQSAGWKHSNVTTPSCCDHELESESTQTRNQPNLYALESSVQAIWNTNIVFAQTIGLLVFAMSYQYSIESLLSLHFSPSLEYCFVMVFSCQGVSSRIILYLYIPHVGIPSGNGDCVLFHVYVCERVGAVVLFPHSESKRT